MFSININEANSFDPQNGNDCIVTDLESFCTFAHEVQNHFSILHINARSLPKNFDNIIGFLASINNYPFSVIAISETWLSDNDYVDLYAIPGYTFVCKGRGVRKGGGVGIYIREGFEFY